MKLRSLIVASVVFIVLAGVLYWSQNRKPAEPAKASADIPPAILKLDEASITKLELKKRGEDLIVLAKNNSGAWQITQPKPLAADQRIVSGTLSALSSLNSERVVEDKTSDPKQFGLDQPALQVNISEKNNKTHELMIGDNTPAGGAVYAMVSGDPRVFTITSDSKTSIDKGLNDLRDKRLLTVNPDKIATLDLIRKGQEIEFGRNQDGWQILKPQPLRADGVQVADLVSKLTDARMDLSGSANDAQGVVSAFSRATPVATVKITDQSQTEELQIREDKEKDKDTFYAKSSVVEGVYKVDASLGQALDKNLDDFRNKNVFDFSYNEPTKIEMHDGAKAYSVVKGGADWWINGKKMDPESVQLLISNLRDLSASRFTDSGFGQPTIDLIITSDDGKRVEKVSIAKSGDGFLAKRENEPAMYYLEAGAVIALEKAADNVKPARVESALYH
jgi:Domain of unknown function (DUF4340)